MLIFDILYAISFVYLFYYNVLLNNAEIVYHIKQIIYILLYQYQNIIQSTKLVIIII